MSAHIDATINDLPELRARLARLKGQAEEVSATMHAARARMVEGDDPKALKTFTEARATGEALSEAIAELERRITATEAEAEARQRAARDEQILAGVARDARQEAADELELFEAVATLVHHNEAKLTRIAELFEASGRRQEALLDAARQLGRTIPALSRTKTRT